MLYKGSQLAVQDSEIERQIAITRGDQLFWSWNIKPWCLLEKLQVRQELISGCCVTLLIFLWWVTALKENHDYIGIGVAWECLSRSKMYLCSSLLVFYTDRFPMADS